MAKNDQAPQADKPVEQQAREQTGQQVSLQIDERELQTCYANAFRSNGTAEEVLLDFGLNQLRPPVQGQTRAEILFQVNQRVIVNYYTAKRLAIALSQMVRRHEEQFGELEMDVAKRTKKV